MRKNDKETELLTVQQAAAFLNVSPGTIRRWAYQDQLKGRKIGVRGDWRFTKDELRAVNELPFHENHGKHSSNKNEDLAQDNDVPNGNHLEKEPSMLEAIVQSSDDAIVSKTLDGIIRSWNQGAENIFEYSAEEAVGKHISLIIPPERLEEEKMILSRLRRGERIDHFDTKRISKSGAIIDISLTVSPIKNRQGKIIGASKIARDISDRKQHEAMLRKEEKRKDEFLAVLAHELRNPLSPISSAAEMLQLKAEQTDYEKEAVDIIQRQVQHMVRLIDDLLDISRIKRGKFEIKKDPVDLGEVINAAIETSQMAIQSAGHRLVTSHAPQRITINGDYVRLAQAVSNLVSNAARYTPNSGTIWLETEEENGEAVITVRDTGVGISKKALPKIFDMFMQGKPASGVNGGLGIGLTLVKRLVEMHGGTVHVKSPGPDLGSTFTIRLPIASQLSADLVDNQKTNTVSGQRILIVDDNKDALAMLATTLRMQGNQIAVATDGIEAIKATKEFNPQIILMDIGMPNMNGYQAAKLIRADTQDPALKLIAVTGWGQMTDKMRAQEAGFDAHVTKPIDTKTLAQLLSL